MYKSRKLGDFTSYRKHEDAVRQLVWKMYSKIGVSKVELMEVTGLGRILIDRYIKEGKASETPTITV